MKWIVGWPADCVCRGLPCCSEGWGRAAAHTDQLGGSHPAWAGHATHRDGQWCFSFVPWVLNVQLDWRVKVRERECVSVHMSVCISVCCVCVCMCSRVHVCLCVFVCKWIHVNVCMLVHVCVCMHKCVYHVRVCALTCIWSSFLTANWGNDQSPLSQLSISFSWGLETRRNCTSAETINAH